MKLASIRGLSVVSLTDHDTVAGLGEAGDAAHNLGMTFVSGVELDAACRRGTMHILGYGFDPSAESIRVHLAAAQSARWRRNERIFERLRAMGIEIDEQRLMEQRGRMALGRPHIAAALVRGGHAKDYASAFRDYLGEGGKAYAPGVEMTAGACISAIRNAGGVAVLAHPVTLRCESDLELETLVARLESEGLGGIEIWHPGQNEIWRRRLTRLAKRFDLVATGGSDTHVVSDHEKRGAGFGERIDARIVDDLMSRIAR